jgi:hypothetical protein
MSKADDKRRRALESKILDSLRRNPEGIARADLYIKTVNRRIRSALLDQVLLDLVARGLVVSDTRKVTVTRTMDVTYYQIAAPAPPPASP